MHHVLNWLWQGCAVAFATCLMLRLLQRSRAKERYLLCWIALVVVVVLPILPSVGAALSAAQTLLDRPRAGSSVISVPSAWWTSTAIVAALWMGWFALSCVRLARAFAEMRGMVGNSLVFPADVESRLPHWTGVRMCGRTTRLVVSNQVPSAAVVGCGSPVIAVAPVLLQRLSIDELDRVVIHEWAHVQRRDDLLNLAHVAARALTGWHPGVWWLERQLQNEREAACDEIAVQIVGSPKGYAACLATLATLFPRRIQPLPAIGALSSPGLRARVIRILSQKRLLSPRRSTSAAIGAVVLLGALSCALAGFRLVDAAPSVSRVSAGQGGPPLLSAQTRSSSTRIDNISSSRETRAPNAPTVESRRAATRVPEGSAASAPVLAGFGSPFTAVLSAERPAGREHVSAGLSVSAPPLTVLSRTTPPLTTIAAPPSPSILPAGSVRPAHFWEIAADRGVAVGKASQNAGMATAGFFSRFGKKVAASF